jgi:hypothetical protein
MRSKLLLLANLLLAGCTELTIGNGAHTGEIDIEDSIVNFGGFRVAPTLAVDTGQVKEPQDLSGAPPQGSKRSD